MRGDTLNRPIPYFRANKKNEGTIGLQLEHKNTSYDYWTGKRYTNMEKNSKIDKRTTFYKLTSL